MLKDLIRVLNISQKKAAETIGMPLRTLENWVGAARKPSEWIEQLAAEKLLRDTTVTAYKNVDIEDLPSILQKGILSLDVCGNNNWEDGKRAANRTDVVYLFKPLGKQNSFTNYGAVLLEVKVKGLIPSALLDADINKGKYLEFITPTVTPEEISAIYIPEILKSRVEEMLPDEIIEKVTWCGIAAFTYDSDEYVEASQELLERFARTAPIESANTCCFFRGSNPDRTLIYLYEVQYIF